MNTKLQRALRSTALAAAIALAPAVTLAAPLTYTFDTVHSRLTFFVSHLGFSNSVGQLSVAPGTFVFDTADWSKGQVTATLPATSLAFGDAKWDAHIQGADFLDAAKYPTITFTATKVEQTAGTNTGTLTGDLTVHGVTKPVTLQLRLNSAGPHPFYKVPAIGFTATGTLKRTDFGVAAYIPMVGDELDVRLEVEARQAP